MTGTSTHPVPGRVAHRDRGAYQPLATRPGGRAAHAGHRTATPHTLLTIAEVLSELQVARSTFDTWRSLGTAPECIKLPNGQIRIRRCALDSWLSARAEIVDGS
jgi:predicted DNA-binding transcriptional regulator AlpA